MGCVENSIKNLGGACEGRAGDVQESEWETARFMRCRSHWQGSAPEAGRVPRSGRQMEHAEIHPERLRAAPCGAGRGRQVQNASRDVLRPAINGPGCPEIQMSNDARRRQR